MWQKKHRKIETGRKKTRIRLQTFAFASFLCFTAIAFYYSGMEHKSYGSETGAAKVVETGSLNEAGLKYSDFPHSKHKQKCSACHKFPSSNWKRARKDAFPDITEYPRHESCLDCHRKQFFGSARPAICTICHVNPTPKNTTRRAFPNPATRSDFAVGFPHETHIEIVARTERKFENTIKEEVRFIKATFKRTTEESCAVCHKTYSPQGDSDSEYFTEPPKTLDDGFWLKKGAFKTSPSDHTTCFTCHSADIGIEPAPNNCAVCHKPKPRAIKTDFDPKLAGEMKIRDGFVIGTWKSRHSSATFRHELSSHADMDCATCHDVSTIRTLDFMTTKVNVLSCSMCHITETSDDGGILNYEVDERKADARFTCVKCHIAFGKLPIPDSHLKAITAQAGE